MEYFYLIKATQKSGKADAIIWRSAKSEARAQLQLDVDLEDAEIETGRGKDYLKPIRTDFPVFNDLPAEGVLDFEWCKRYQLGDDQRTWQVIPGAVADSTTVVEDEIVNGDSDDNDSDASDDTVSGDENSLYNLAEMPFRIQLLAQYMAEERHVYHISIPHRGRLSAMELDTDNSAVQDLILAAESIPEIKKYDMPALWKFTSANKKVFPEGKRHELGKRIQFAKLWFETNAIDRGILTREWAVGNQISAVPHADTHAIPAHLAGKPADCMAIVMQAMQWGMNPYAVAQKTHLVNGVLGYEAQLVNAVIASSSAIHGRFHYRYGGDWERCTRTQEVTREKHGKNGKYNVTERVRGWTDEDEIGLFVQVGAILRGESEITWGEPLYLSGVVTRNSPLWVSNPKQQIAYLGVKYWARLYCPEVILGVYSPDEVGQRPEREINPAPAQKMSVADITSRTDITTSAQESGLNIDSLADDFRDRIERAESVDAAKAIRADLDKEKAVLGTVLFTELKGKAVQRYFMVDARNKVEAAINSLPNPGDPEAETLFAKAESTLTSSRRHLGDELYDQFRITLDDMKPEYIC